MPDRPGPHEARIDAPVFELRRGQADAERANRAEGRERIVGEAIEGGGPVEPREPRGRVGVAGDQVVGVQAPSRPLFDDAPGQVFAQPGAARQVAEGRREGRDEGAPRQAVAQAPERRPVSIVPELRRDHDRARDVARLVDQTDELSPEAVPEDRDRTVAEVLAHVRVRRAGVEVRPLRHRGPVAAERRRPRAADAPVVVGDDAHAVLGEERREGAVEALGRGRPRVEDQRAARGAARRVEVRGEGDSVARVENELGERRPG